MTRSELYKEEVWSKLLRPDDGDPSVATFLPRDEFKVCCRPTPLLRGSSCVNLTPALRRSSSL